MQPQATSVIASSPPRIALRRRPFANMGWMEAFIFCQFLLAGIMFLPGAQAFRIVVRTLPYLSCALLLPVYQSRIKNRKLAPGSPILMAALLVLALELMHPQTAAIAGFAQCSPQLCLA